MAQKTSGLAILSGERTLRALELRKEGQTFVAIGQELGVSPQAVHKRVAKVLRLMSEEIEEEGKILRQLEAERLDALQRACWDQAMDGDLRAIEQVLRIIDRRSRLFGIEQIPTAEGPSFEELRDRIARFFRGDDEHPTGGCELEADTDSECWELAHPPDSVILEAIPQAGVEE